MDDTDTDRLDDPVDDPDCAELCDPARLAALARSGLAAGSDPVMEAYAERVRDRLEVPVALVSLVQPDRQVFPGMIGFHAEPWSSQRATPLSHSFCQHVVVSGLPLIIEDARVDPLVRDNLAIPDLGVIAYAGMPLRDSSGNVLGSLCAIDVVPRRWTGTEVETLRDLAGACSTELSLRLARYDADLERAGRDQLEQAQRRSIDRTHSLLAASQAFTDTATVRDVRDRVDDLLASELQPAYVGLALAAGPDDPTDARTGRDLESAIASSAQLRAGRTLAHPSPGPGAVAPDGEVLDLLAELGLRTLVAAPLLGTDDLIGALVLGWRSMRQPEPSELLMIDTVAGYASRAVSRARVLAHRTSAAHEMQRAMLTTLPELPGVDMAAKYAAADSREHVGGDWYDAVAGPGDDVLTISVGDVIGHTLGAATLMGQARSMLRQAVWDHPDASPAAVFSAFERASTGVRLDVAGTAILAQLRPRAAGGWTMTWTNAGHPPPVLLGADGSAKLLPGHGLLFGFPALYQQPRTDLSVDLEPGSTLFLYTDGLVEQRHRDLDAGTDELLRFLDRHRDLPPRVLVDLVVRTLGARSADDVVAFAVRAGDRGPGRVSERPEVTPDPPPAPPPPPRSGTAWRRWWARLRRPAE